MAFAFQCPGKEVQYEYRIENATELTLKIAMGSELKILGPHASTTYSYADYDGRWNVFDHVIGSLGTCSVFSDDKLLKTWTMNGRNDGGKQLFNVYSWTYDSPKAFHMTYTFEISPEDLGL